MQRSFCNIQVYSFVFKWGIGCSKNGGDLTDVYDRWAILIATYVDLFNDKTALSLRWFARGLLGAARAPELFHYISMRANWKSTNRCEILMRRSSRGVLWWVRGARGQFWCLQVNGNWLVTYGHRLRKDHRRKRKKEKCSYSIRLCLES